MGTVVCIATRWNAPLIASFMLEPNSWLFETIPGSDALLIAAPRLPKDLPIGPTLSPSQLKQLAKGAPLNTDDAPWIEFEAPNGSIVQLAV